MDGLTRTIGGTVLASAGMEQTERIKPAASHSSYSALPARKRAKLLTGDPFMVNPVGNTF